MRQYTNQFKRMRQYTNQFIRFPFFIFSYGCSLASCLKTHGNVYNRANVPRTDVCLTLGWATFFSSKVYFDTDNIIRGPYKIIYLIISLHDLISVLILVNLYIASLGGTTVLWVPTSRLLLTRWLEIFSTPMKRIVKQLRSVKNVYK